MSQSFGVSFNNFQTYRLNDAQPFKRNFFRAGWRRQYVSINEMTHNSPSIPANPRNPKNS